MAVRRVCIEGNIGSGKSTVLDLAAARLPDLAAAARLPDQAAAARLQDPAAAARLQTAVEAVEAFPEPLHAWGDLLRQYYDDPVQWSLALQLQALLSFGPPARCANACLVERSPLSCRHVFGQMLFNENKLSQGEWELFKRYHDVLGWTPDLIVYVHAPPEVCYERMLRRARQAEANVDLQFIRRLDFQYETMLRYANVPIVRMDGTLPAEQLAEQVAHLVLEKISAVDA